MDTIIALFTAYMRRNKLQFSCDEATLGSTGEVAVLREFAELAHSSPRSAKTTQVLPASVLEELRAAARST